VNTKSGSKDDTSNYGEKRSKSIGNQQSQRNCKTGDESSNETKDQDNPCKDGCEYGIVDCAWVTSERGGDDMSNQSCDDDGEEELNTSDCYLADLHDGDLLM